MIFNTLNPELIERTIKLLKKKNVPYVLELGRSTEKLKYNGDIMNFCSKKLELSDLGFINKVKKCAQDSNKPRVNVSNKDISYYRVNDIRDGEIYYNCREIDVNSAYWNLARKFGYISEPIYKEGIEMGRDKKYLRLISLGSLATQKLIMMYDGENEFVAPPKCNEITRSYFFHVSKVLDDIMNDIFQAFNSHMLFFWVDAFFIKHQSMDDRFISSEIELKLKKLGLGIKFKSIEYITRVGDKIVFKKEGEPETYVYHPIGINRGKGVLKRAITAYREGANHKL